MNDFKKEFDDIMGDLVDQCDSVTYVCFVMDHSGSMSMNQKESMDNFNGQLKTLKQKAIETGIQTIVSVVEFDDKIVVPVENQEVSKVQPLKTYWINGMTALYDAIAKGISIVNNMMLSDPREDKAALLIVQTDGAENMSTEFNGESGRVKVKEMIEKLEKQGDWTFVFMAEGIDKQLAEGLAFSAVNTMQYDKSERGYDKALNSTIRGVGAYYTSRAAGQKNVKNFFDDDFDDSEYNMNNATQGKSDPSTTGDQNEKIN